MFVINEKEYNPLAFDFNLMCDLEDAGFSIGELASKNMKAIRAYFALCAGIGVVDAGREIEQHVIKGGTLKELSACMGEEMEKSDFFQALIKGMQEENAKKDAENQTETAENTEV